MWLLKGSEFQVDGSSLHPRPLFWSDAPGLWYQIAYSTKIWTQSLLAVFKVLSFIMLGNDFINHQCNLLVVTVVGFAILHLLTNWCWWKFHKCKACRENIRDAKPLPIIERQDFRKLPKAWSKSAGLGHDIPVPGSSWGTKINIT